MSLLQLTKIAEPPTPAANKTVVFVDTADDLLKSKNDAGVVTPLTGEVGNWINVPFAAGNYTSVGGSWTVGSGDQLNLQYILIGRVCIINIVLDATTVGAGASELRITVPITPAKNVALLAILYDNSASVGEPCQVLMQTSTGAMVRFIKFDGTNFTPSTNNTYIRAQIIFEW